MNSTTSISSPRTSSTPATSVQLVSVFAPTVMFAGVVRGSIPRVFQSTQPMKTKISSMNTASHWLTNTFSCWKK